MTSETVNVLEMADIIGVEVRCRNAECIAKVVVSCGVDQKMPADCSACGHALFDAQLSSWSFAEQLRASIRALLKNDVQNVRLQVVGVIK